MIHASLSTAALEEAELNESSTLDEGAAGEAATAPAGALDTSLPSRPVMDSAWLTAELADIWSEEFDALGSAQTVVSGLRLDVTDLAGLRTYLRATVDALSQDLGQEAAESFRVAVEAILDATWLLVNPTGALYEHLVADTAAEDNLLLFFEGIFQGLEESGLLDAESVARFVATSVSLSVASPLYLMALVAGTVYQIVMDLVGIIELLATVLGNFPELIEFLKQVPEIAKAVVDMLYDSSSGTVMQEAGRNLGLVMGTSVERDLLPDFQGDVWEVGSQLMKFAFFMGTTFGQIILDVALTLTGVGFVEVAIKWIGKALKYAADAARALIDLVTSLLKAVDPQVLKKLTALGTKLAEAADAKMRAVSEKIADGLGSTAEEVEEGFATLRATLGDEKYESTLTKLFCSLT